MVKHEVYDSMERGYSDTVVSSTTSPTAHSRSTSTKEKEKEREAHQRALSEAHEINHGHGHGHGHGHARKHSAPLTVHSVGRAIAARGMRALRRGNLLFMIVFVTALFVFFGALAGIGYVDPDAQAPAPESEFVMGQPVFDAAEGQRLRELAMKEQRALEEQWAKKKRPNAGAWMKKQRNDGAVRAAAQRKKAEEEARAAEALAEPPVETPIEDRAEEKTDDDEEESHNHDDH